MAITLVQMNSAIHDTLENALTLVAYLDDYDDLTEGLPNTPVVQVYWSSMATVSEGSATDRRTFGGNASAKPVRMKRYIFRVDLYCDPISNLDKMFAQMLPIVDEINDVLEAQDQKPYFGLTGIQSYTFSCDRTSLEYAKITYPVVQWTIELSVF